MKKSIRKRVFIIFFILIFMSVGTLFFVFLKNMLEFLLEQKDQEYLTLMEQISINIRYDLEKIKKNLDEIFSDNEILNLLNIKKFNSAIEEINYDNKLGNELRKKIIPVISGDITLLEFDKSSLLDNSKYKATSYTLGNFRINVDRLLYDQLYLELLNSKDNIVIGSLNNESILGFDIDNRSVILYAIRKNNAISKIVAIILTSDYYNTLYSHIKKLRYGTIFILDNYNNIINVNHPSKNDEFEFKDGKYQYSFNLNTIMTYDDYNKLIIDKNILYEKDLLTFFDKNNFDDQLTKNSENKTKIINYKNNRYLLTCKIDKKHNIKYIFLIHNDHILRPFFNFLKILLSLSILIILIMFFITLIFNKFFIVPIENDYLAIEEKNLFFMNLAHEIKTPLTLIKNYIDKYIKEYGDNNYIKVIVDNIDKLLNDIYNLLDSKKLEEGKFIYDMNKYTDFSELLNMKKSLYIENANKKEIKMNFDIENNLIVKVDPIALDRIVNNLIDNALKYTDNNGFINVTLRSNKDRVDFIVKDTGVGIKKSDITKILQPYSQIKNKLGSSKGIGLGLFIVNNIIKQFNGSLDINSEINKGSIFTVKFKLYKDVIIDKSNLKIDGGYKSSTSVFTKKDLKVNDFELGKPTIFIVEDNIDILYYLINSLNNIYNIYYATNGNEAKKIIKENIKPDIIISDIMMPESDGFDFLKFINNDKELYDIPIIFQSAINNVDMKIKAFHNGVVDFITKPYSIDLLIARIDSLLKFQSLKKDLYEKDKFASLGMLLGGISHEIFNPLLGISSPLENIENIIENKIAGIDNNIKEKLMKHISDIEKNVNRIENIIKSLKVLYYQNDNQIEDIDMSKILNSIYDLLFLPVKDRINFKYEIDDKFKIKGNYYLLTQILMNLVSNSIDAIPDKGEISVLCKVENNKMCIYVKDNGIGIKDEIKNKIFNAFFTTKDVGKGTGLGLYLVKDFVNKSGWKIDFSSKENFGTEFKITIG